MRRCEVCSVEASSPNGWRMFRRGDRHVDVCPLCVKALDRSPPGTAWGYTLHPGGKW